MSSPYLRQPKRRNSNAGIAGVGLIALGGATIVAAPLVALPALAVGGSLVKEYYSPRKKLFDRNKRKSIF